MYIEIVQTSIPQTYTNIFGRKMSDPISRCQNHLHNEIELMYVLEGCVKWEFQNATILSEKGDIVYVNSRIPHATEVMHKHTSNIIIQFDIEKLMQDHTVQKNKYLKRLINGDEAPYYRFVAGEAETKELALYMDKIDTEVKENKKAHHIYIKSHIFSVIAFLFRHNYLKDSDSICMNHNILEKITPFLTYIDNNYQNDITLDNVSKYFDLNPSYLCRLFKRATNSTFTNYLNLVRIMNAENLLTTTNDSILEVALSVGFSNVSYFNRIFKNYTNCTPGFYKKIKFCK